MRNPIVFFTLVALATSSLIHSQEVLPTPNEADIPTPVPAETSLAGSPRPDISRFLNVRSAIDPSLSPDGTQVAFRTGISGTPQLWVVDSVGGWPRQLTFGESVTFHQWSPAGAWVIYGTDRGGNEREGYYLISPDVMQERELIAPAEAFRVFGGFTRDGKRIAYATTERNGVAFDIHLVDLATKQDREVFRGRMGLYARSWRPDAGAVILSESRGEDANDAFLLDVESGKVTTLFQPKIASSYTSFTWQPDGSGFYLATNQDQEYAALAYYDVANRELSMIDVPTGDVEQVALSGDGRWLAWTINDQGYSKLIVRDLDGGEDVSLPDLPRGVYSIKWAGKAPVVSIRVESPRIPGDIWTWNAATRVLRRATQSDAAGLDLSRMIVPQHYSFTAPDGVTLHGLLYMPFDSGPNVKPPVLLKVHGGPTAQARPRFSAAEQYLVSRGIAVFDFNYRGSTGYGKTFARLNDRRLREGEFRDMAHALDWLATRGDVDAGRAAVMGGSYGGYLTMAALTRLPDRFKSGVAFVGVANWVTALEGASPELKASDRLEYGDIRDAEDREFFRKISPITYVANVKAPAMVLHGANDPRDPPTESDQFVRGIREQGGEIEYLRFPDEGHGIRKLSNQVIAYRRIAAFLERTLAVP